MATPLLALVLLSLASCTPTAAASPSSEAAVCHASTGSGRCFKVAVDPENAAALATHLVAKGLCRRGPCGSAALLGPVVVVDKGHYQFLGTTRITVHEASAGDFVPEGDRALMHDAAQATAQSTVQATTQTPAGSPSLPPMIFVSGLTGSTLVADVNKAKKHPWSTCGPHFFCVCSWKGTLWLANTQMLPGVIDCTFDNRTCYSTPSLASRHIRSLATAVLVTLLPIHTLTHDAFVTLRTGQALVPSTARSHARCIAPQSPTLSAVYQYYYVHYVPLLTSTTLSMPHCVHTQ